MKEKHRKYSISCTEEVIFNPDFSDFIAGRIEIYEDGEPYQIDEIRFLTKKTKEFYSFQEENEDKSYNENELDELIKFVESNFYEQQKK